MSKQQDKLTQLSERLELLSNKQVVFSREIDDLRGEINRLKTTGINPIVENTAAIPDTAKQKQVVEPIQEQVKADQYNYQPPTVIEPPQYVPPKIGNASKVKSDFEKFIGENLINKIGIVITIIGVAIGAKYSIEHQLISPLTRIILGYLTGAGLLGFGMKLKKKYENYSAVLVSGAMTIMYFLTYAAYSFYDLIPQTLAFLLMLAFTAFTVVAAINYNRQVIALIGLVGAYAVPFLLSEGSGKVAILFSYMTIINTGILVIAFKKYWKPLYYSSFLLTWLIFFPGMW